MPSENTVASGSPDRRTRKRAARRDHLLDLAADLVDRTGVTGVTMAALAEAADYAPASLYTYFPSRSALLAALQQRALVHLAGVAQVHLAEWDAELAALDPAPTAAQAALARLYAFSDLFLAAPERFPREFRLQQQLFVSAGVQDVADAATVVPTAMVVLDVPRRLLAAAEVAGALTPHDPTVDPLDELTPGAVLRTLSWIVGLNGALMADGLVTGLPSTGTRLGDELTDTLLRGWGAPADALSVARDLAHSWVR